MGFFDYLFEEIKPLSKKKRKATLYKHGKVAFHRTKNGEGIISRLFKKK